MAQTEQLGHRSWLERRKYDLAALYLPILSVYIHSNRAS